ncbi:MAG: hypothetical protein HY879_02585 [Deltaproteobacteria bacterium]|nr:hypothetical protein [Deltaproteobacteria bacterium]
MKFCSFRCEQADNEKAQHAACLAVNGVFCGILLRVVEKGAPCPVENSPAGSNKPRKSNQSG